MRIERIVIDTNVLISAIISPHGKPRRCVEWCLNNAIIISSAEMLAELETRLETPRIAKRVTPLQRKAVLVTVREAALVLPVTPIPPTCRDSGDDIVLATAASGRADCIVSGDDDLLVLISFRNNRILSPTDFLEAVGEAT